LQYTPTLALSSTCSSHRKLGDVANFEKSPTNLEMEKREVGGTVKDQNNNVKATLANLHKFQLPLKQQVNLATSKSWQGICTQKNTRNFSDIALIVRFSFDLQIVAYFPSTIEYIHSTLCVCECVLVCV